MNFCTIDTISITSCSSFDLLDSKVKHKQRFEIIPIISNEVKPFGNKNNLRLKTRKIKKYQGSAKSKKFLHKKSVSI